MVKMGANALGGFAAVRSPQARSGMGYGVAVGAGFMLAVALLEVLPEGMARTSHAPLLALVGFGLIHACEHALTPHFHFGEEVHPEAMVGGTPSIAALIGLMIHSLVEGLSIAGGMASGPFLGLLIFFGIVLHSFPEGFTIGSIMVAAGRSARMALLSSALIGAAAVVGTCSVFLMGSGSPAVVGVLLSLAAGSFLYIAATDLIPMVNELENKRTAWAVFAGMALFYGVSRLHKAVM